MAGATGRYRVAIAGASGYGGAETLRWLATHPGFEVCGITSRSNAGRPLEAVHPHLAGFHEGLSFVANPEDLIETQPDAVVMALPHRYAAAYADSLHRIFPELRIVDLSPAEAEILDLAAVKLEGDLLIVAPTAELRRALARRSKRRR